MQISAKFRLGILENSYVRLPKTIGSVAGVDTAIQEFLKFKSSAAEVPYFDSQSSYCLKRVFKFQDFSNQSWFCLLYFSFYFKALKLVFKHLMDLEYDDPLIFPMIWICYML